jgi:hypothetical protein
MLKWLKRWRRDRLWRARAAAWRRLFEMLEEPEPSAEALQRQGAKVVQARSKLTSK